MDITFNSVSSSEEKEKGAELHPVGKGIRFDCFTGVYERGCSCACIKIWLTSPLLVAAAFCFVMMYFNCVMQVYAQHRSSSFLDIPKKYNMSAEDTAKINELPDVGFDLLKPVLQEHWLADAWVGAMIGVTFVRFLATGMRVTILRRWLSCLGTLFGIRALSIIATLLPNPSHTCIATAVGNPWYEGIMILTGRHATCADVLYSGHTVNMTLCAMVWHTYSHVTPLTEWDPLTCLCCNTPLVSKMGDLLRCTSAKVLIWCAATAGYLVIIATHFHYTVDVLLGLVLTLVFWAYYHYYIRYMFARATLGSRILQWMERDAEDLEIHKNAQPCRQCGERVSV